MRALALATIVAVIAAGLLAAAPAQARPCSDRVPVIIEGVRWIVYTGDSRAETREIPCRKARRIAKRFIKTGEETGRWECSERRQRCVKGGTRVDKYGWTHPRYLIGWHASD